MDSTDSEILRLLRDDGRMSWRDWAAVGLTANAGADASGAEQSGVSRLRRARRTRRGGPPPRGTGRVTLRGARTATSSRSSPPLEPVTEVLHLSGAPTDLLRSRARHRQLDTLLRKLRNRAGAEDTDTTIVLR